VPPRSHRPKPQKARQADHNARAESRVKGGCPSSGPTLVDVPPSNRPDFFNTIGRKRTLAHRQLDDCNAPFPVIDACARGYQKRTFGSLSIGGSLAGARLPSRPEWVNIAALIIDALWSKL